jgi:hypothetical protein
MKKLLTTFILGVSLIASASAIDLINGFPRAFVLDMPALSSSDGVTPQTGITVSNFTVNAYKKGKKAVPVTIAACVYSNQTLTSTGTNPANNDSLTIGPVTREGVAVTNSSIQYIFKTTLTGAAYEIKIAASASLTLDNVKCAINDSGCSEGTDYGTGTITHPTVNATTKTATTLLFVSNIPGSAENSTIMSELSGQLSFGAATLAGGTDNCMVHDANGFYWFAAPGTLLDTRGDFKLTFNVSGAAPFMQLGRVVAGASNDINVEGNVTTSLGIWDVQTSALDEVGSVGKRVADNVNATVSSRATPGDISGGLDEGTAQAGSSTTITLATSASSVDDYYKRRVVTTESGTGAGQEAIITGYVGSTRVATVWNPAKTDGTWYTNPAAGTAYVVKAAAAGSLGPPILEPGQVTPPAAPTPEQAMGYNYSAIRNRVDEDAATKKFYNDAGQVTWKKPRTAQGNVKTEGEAVAGP